MSKTKLTVEDIDDIIEKAEIEVVFLEPKTTVVKMTLDNGFVLVESSSCVDPKNYDEEVGTHLCLKKIEDQLWQLEGYRLQCEVGRL